MQLYLDISVPSKPEWIEAVMSDFDSFLIDHADCERKASSFMLSLVAKYPDRTEIIADLIDTAIEELEHFQQVYALMEKRNLRLPNKMVEDLYIKSLIKKIHSGRNERFLDRLLIGSVIETRGAERFRLVSEHIEDKELSRYYKNLWTNEAKHGNIFVEMALNYFDKKTVYDRLNWLNEEEGKIVDQLEIRAALH